MQAGTGLERPASDAGGRSSISLLHGNLGSKCMVPLCNDGWNCSFGVTKLTNELVERNKHIEKKNSTVISYFFN